MVASACAAITSAGSVASVRYSVISGSKAAHPARVRDEGGEDAPAVGDRVVLRHHRRREVRHHEGAPELASPWRPTTASSIAPSRRCRCQSSGRRISSVVAVAVGSALTTRLPDAAAAIPSTPRARISRFEHREGLVRDVVLHALRSRAGRCPRTPPAPAGSGRRCRGAAGCPPASRLPVLGQEDRAVGPRTSRSLRAAAARPSWRRSTGRCPGTRRAPPAAPRRGVRIRSSISST